MYVSVDKGTTLLSLTKVTGGDANSLIFVCVLLSLTKITVGDAEMPLLGEGGGGTFRVGTCRGGTFSLASIAPLSFPEVEYLTLLFPLLKPS